MVRLPDGPHGKGVDLTSMITQDTRFNYGVPVGTFADYFGVKNTETRAVLEKYPTLCYLLGSITSSEPEIKKKLRDGSEGRIYLLTEGSGTFGLDNKDDALEWSGIFNHVVGAARQVYWLAERLKSLSPEQKKKFVDAGFSFSDFDQYSPEFLRDFMLVTHAGRRGMDELNWYKDRVKVDEAHPSSNSEYNTRLILQKYNAPKEFLELMRVENHDNLIQEGALGRFEDIVFNILTYCDWTYGQDPVELETRFKQLEESKRQLPEVLSILKSCGMSFEQTLKETLGEDIWKQMASAGPFEWETEIRKAYCAPSGLDFIKAFPSYLAQYPQIQDQL